MQQFWKVRNVPFCKGRTSELMSTKANQVSSWTDVVLLLATRCLLWGVHLSWVYLTANVKLTWHSTAQYWAHINWTQVSSTVDHEMPLPGGYIWAGYIWLQMSSWPNVVQLLATRCLYQGGTSDLCMSVCNLPPKLIFWKCQADLT